MDVRPKRADTSGWAGNRVHVFASMTLKSSSTVTDTSQLQLQLPIWPQDLRGLPNAFARSALFSVSNIRSGGERANLKRHLVASLKGIEMTYTGEALRQDDEDVFLQILHLARHQPVSTAIKFNAFSMISELGWTKNASSYKRLVDCIDRMKASSVALTVSSASGARENYTGSLIRSFRWKEVGSELPIREWEVLLEPEIVTLFNPQSYSRLDWKMRLKLPPLEKWLHSFYHTHSQPYPYSVKKIHELTGSEIPISELRKFRYKLKKALEQLVKLGFFESAAIDPRTDLVHVERSRSHQSIVQR